MAIFHDRKMLGFMCTETVSPRERRGVTIRENESTILYGNIARLLTGETPFYLE